MNANVHYGICTVIWFCNGCLSMMNIFSFLCFNSISKKYLFCFHFRVWFIRLMTYSLFCFIYGMVKWPIYNNRQTKESERERERESKEGKVSSIVRCWPRSYYAMCLRSQSNSIQFPQLYNSLYETCSISLNLFSCSLTSPDSSLFVCYFVISHFLVSPSHLCLPYWQLFSLFSLGT